MRTTAEVGIAAFAVDGAGIRSCAVDDAPRLRSASVLKPLLFWAAFGAEVPSAWAALAQRAVVASDNDAASELWSHVGEEALLRTIEERTGVAWHTDIRGAHAWRRVLVTADELARAYAVFSRDDNEAALRLRAWMREVPAEQTFGARDVACETLGVDPATVGVKCGWYAIVRTHAVTIVEQEGRRLGAAVTTYRPQDASSRAVYAATRDIGSVLAAHAGFAGPLVRDATRRGLEAATRL